MIPTRTVDSGEGRGLKPRGLSGAERQPCPETAGQPVNMGCGRDWVPLGREGSTQEGRLLPPMGGAGAAGRSLSLN